MADNDRTGMLEAILKGSHLALPDDVPGLIAEHARAIGARDVGLYLADYEERMLIPAPNPDSPTREAVGIDSTVAGRAYRHVTVEHTTSEAGRERVWLPLLDGSERIGVLEVQLDGDWEEKRIELEALAGLTAELVMTKQVYGDFFEQVRRRQPMSLTGELIRQLVPPHTFANHRVVITAKVAPTYEVGGDAFDYAVDRQTARVAVVDAMGHGLEAGLLATVALAAYRNARRQGLDLAETAAYVDHAIEEQFEDQRFVTAILAELDLPSGRLRWCSAGHPRPLLLRGRKVVRSLSTKGGTPFGVGFPGWPIEEEALEPGDRLVLHTDGVVEARDSSGEFFGQERLIDFITNASASRTPPPETIRRLFNAILDHQSGALQDDATVLLVEWRGPGPSTLVL